MKEKKDLLGLSWLIPALIFLFNPNINIIDLLPDFIGYIFLCLGLAKIADLNDSIASALSLFQKMILIDLGKWAAILWTFSLSASGEKNSSLLLFTFVFSTVELIVLLPAYTKLFYGLTKFGYFYSSQLLICTNQKGKTFTDRAKIATIAFVIVKAVFSVLPEFADLSNSAYDEGSSFVGIYRYIGVLRGFAFIIVLVFGIIWLCKLQSYFAKLRRDQALLSALSAEYDAKVRPKVGLFIQRSFRLIYLFLILGVLLSINVRLETLILFPDFLAPIAFFLLFITLSNRLSLQKLPWITILSLYFVVAIASFASEVFFFDEYSYSAIMKSDAALGSYVIMALLSFTKVFLFLALVYLTVQELYRIIRRHTGTMIGKESVGIYDQKMEKELHKELSRPFVYALCAATLYGISEVCYDVFAPMLSGIYVKTDATFGAISNIQNHYGLLRSINLILLVVCVCLFIKALSALKTAIQNKYRLE